MPVIIPDFECASNCDLKAAGAWAYSEDPTTEILCLAYGPPDGPFIVWWPGQPLDALLALVNDPATRWVAHNTAFEKAIWRNCMMPAFGVPDILDEKWGDSMASCAMRAIPQDLDRAATVMGIAHQKDKEGRTLTLSLSRPQKGRKNRGMLPERTPEVMARIGQYCAGDTAAEGALLKRIGHLPPKEREIWLLDQKINQRGLRLDLPYIAACKRLVDKAMVPLAAEFADITGGLKWTERDQFLDWMLVEGVSLPNLQKDTIDELLGEGDDEEESLAQPEGLDRSVIFELPPNVKRALNIRKQANASSLKKLARMEKCVCADGRVRGTLAYHGTLPGRWAGRLFQPQNFPRGSLQDVPPATVVAALMTEDPDFVEAILGPPIEAVVSGLRHSITADDGCHLVAGDYAGIQARVVLALAGQHDKTTLLASGADIYCDMAAAIYGRPIDKKRDPEERHTGKNAVLGLGFQMGWRKFTDKYARKHPEEFVRRVVDTYRQTWAPCVPKLWYALEDAAVRAVWDRRPVEAYGILYQLEDVWLTARLPSGRKLWYPFPEAVRKAMPWDETDIRPGFTFKAMKLGQWRTIHAFGGQLTENVVMGIERDIMTGGMLRLEAHHYPLVLQVHDDAMAERAVDEIDTAEYTSIMCDVEPWVTELRVPITVETWTGGRFRK